MTIVNWNCIDWEPVDFVEHFHRIHNTAVASGNPNDDGREQNSASNSSKIESSSCRCTTTSIEKSEKQRNLYSDFFRSCGGTQEDSLKEIGHSSDLEQKKCGTELHTYKPNGFWNHAAGMMKIRLRESGHLYSEKQVRWPRIFEKTKEK